MIRFPNQEYYIDQYGKAPSTAVQPSEAWEDFENSAELGFDHFVGSESESFDAISDEELLRELGQTEGGADEGAQGAELLKALREEIQDSASSPALAGEERAQFQGRVEALSKSFLGGSLSLDQLAEKIDLLRQDFLTAVETAGLERDRALEAIDGRLQTLFGEEFENSELDNGEKRSFRDRANRMMADLKAGKLEVEAAEDQVEALREEIETAITDGGLLAGFDHLHSKIPAKGFAWQATVLIAEQLSAGLRSQDWSELRATLAQGGNGAEPVIQQLIGSIYYYVAGEDEKKLTAALQLIPQDIRETMEALLLSDPKRHYDTSGLNDEADRRAHAYYGTPFSTAARIRSSLKDSH